MNLEIFLNSFLTTFYNETNRLLIYVQLFGFAIFLSNYFNLNNYAKALRTIIFMRDEMYR